jgi:hypothetical protein
MDRFDSIEGKENKCGIVYIATGKDFVKEASISAKTVKDCMPDTPIAIITDVENPGEVFDIVISIDDPWYDFRDQVYFREKTPFNKTIFLDTDIYLYESIEDIFSLLDQFDIAIRQNQRNYSSQRINHPELDDVPECFPEYNGAVLGLNMNNKMLEFMDNFKSYYEEVFDKGQVHQQAALRIALYNSDLRIATLPANYHCVFRRKGCVNGTVKVFHGRLLDIDTVGAKKSVDAYQAIDEINSQDNLRIYHTIAGEVNLVQPGLLYRLIYSIKHRGIISTLKIGAEELLK